MKASDRNLANSDRTSVYTRHDLAVSYKLDKPRNITKAGTHLGARKREARGSARSGGQEVHEEETGRAVS